MRRFTSALLTSAVLVATVASTASVASAASGTVTKKTSATVAPAAVANASIIKMVRLSQSNSFLAIGYNSQASGSHLFLWKIKEDLTLDTTFGAVDLGANFALPTASNSTCVAQSQSGCWYLNSIIVNETADRYFFALTRQLNSGSNSNVSASINSFVLGKISTGAVVASVANYEGQDSFDVSDWSAYGATKLTAGICTSTWGSTFQSIALAEYRTNAFSTLIRPDGSLVISLTCGYSNMNGSNSSSNVKEFKNTALIGLKASGLTLVADSSWGTNGVLKTFDDPAKCGGWFPPSPPDTSITSNSSTKVYAAAQVTIGDRTSTYPYGGGVTPASYDGCGYSMPSGSNATAKLLTFKADGSVLATNTTTSLGVTSYFGRWVIDPKGNWNTVVNSGMGQSAVVNLVRLNTKGELDTTFGTGGIKTMSNVPTSVTVNGTSVTMRYMLSGLAVTADGYYFTGFTSTGLNMCNNQNYTSKVYPYYLSPDTGLVTTYGTGGLGEALTLELANTSMCLGSPTLSYINSKGQHGYFAQVPAIGSQAAGLVGATWDAAEGVTSGGEGNGAGSSAASRVDTKVYSTKLPATAQPDSALRVLTAKQAKDFDIRSNTPKICIALTTSVLMVNPGRCTVRIIDEDTKQVIRRMTTVVKNTDVDTGTTLTTDEPIYFKQAGTRLSKTALAQVKELATAAKDAARVVIIGHSAALGEVSEYSYAISRERAEAVKAALVKAGVKTPIEIVAMAYTQPEKTAKTETAQAKNRRAEVYIFPK